MVLSFAHGHTAEPVISNLARDLGVDVSILGGTVETIAGRKVGRLRVALSHASGAVDAAAVEGYLRDREVSVHL